MQPAAVVADRPGPGPHYEGVLGRVGHLGASSMLEVMKVAERAPTGDGHEARVVFAVVADHLIAGRTLDRKAVLAAPGTMTSAMADQVRLRASLN